MKTCSKCKETKELTEYSKDKSVKNGLKAQCRLCLSIALRKYRDENPEIRKKYYEKNKERIAEYAKKRYEKKKDKLLENLKIYYNSNKERINKRNKVYRDNNKERQKIVIKKWRSENKDKVRAIHRKHCKAKMKNDKLYHFKCMIRTNISMNIRRQGYSKRSRTFKILGCSFDELKIHFERQFTKGMNWDNIGKWHIDHIIPMATAKTEEDVIRLNHYTNLRPLWAEENLSKSDKIITHQLVLL